MSNNPSDPRSLGLSRQGGFTLVEAVVALTIFVLGVVGLVSLVLVSKSTSEQGRDAVQAVNYLQEGAEAVRAVRDSAWTNVSTDGAYRLSPQTGMNPPWQLLSGGTESVGGKFNRTVQIGSVSREDTDGNGQLSAGDRIVPTGGTLQDPDTKKITVTVSWQVGNQTKTRTLYVYLTKWNS